MPLLLGNAPNQVPTNGDLGNLAFQDAANIAGNVNVGGSITATSGVINANTTTDALRITQLGAGNALVVEDSANPDATPFVIDASGNVGIGTSSPAFKLDVNGEASISNGTNQVLLSGVSGNIEIVRSDAVPFIDFKSTIAEDYDCRIQQQSNGLAFQTGGNGAASERMRIDSSGTLILNQGQIQFPATQVPSANANTLDDYEEGTWTPVVSPQSGALTSYTATGSYTRIGRAVTINFRIEIVTNGTAGTGLFVTGMPFGSITSNTFAGGSREDQSSGFAVAVSPTAGTQLYISKYDGTYAGGSGNRFSFCITYNT